MTARAFPDIKPSSRSYNPGRFPQTQFQSQNGSVTVMRYSNQRVNSSLQLGFSNITDAEAADILDHYREVNNDWDNATFTTDNAVAGVVDGDMQDYIEEQGALQWRYSEPPTVESTFVGRCNVRCSFTGFFNGN